MNEITMSVKDFTESLLDAYKNGRLDEKYERNPTAYDIKVEIPRPRPQGRPLGSKNKKKK